MKPPTRAFKCTCSFNVSSADWSGKCSQNLLRNQSSSQPNRQAPALICVQRDPRSTWRSQCSRPASGLRCSRAALRRSVRTWRRPAAAPRSSHTLIRCFRSLCRCDPRHNRSNRKRSDYAAAAQLQSMCRITECGFLWPHPELSQ